MFGILTKHFLIIVFIVINKITFTDSRYSEWEQKRPYCELAPSFCVMRRDDNAFMPYYGSRCYCDYFCYRGPNDHDCCPDFEYVCYNLSRPSFMNDRPKYTHKYCEFDGKFIRVGANISNNCNICTCVSVRGGITRLVCTSAVCMNDPSLIAKINADRDLGWTATAYKRWDKKTVLTVKKYSLGAYMNKNEKFRLKRYNTRELDWNIYNFSPPEQWDIRLSGRSINDIRDQGLCGTSWIISALDVAMDRLYMIDTKNGKQENMPVHLSIQHVLSCSEMRARNGCNNGRVDYAWGFLKDFGVILESCYKYSSGNTGIVQACKENFKNLRVSDRYNRITNGKLCTNSHCESKCEVFQFGPAYRVPEHEKLIQYELYTRGPIQATFLVCEDFYQYRSGVYRLAVKPSNLCGYHSVRLIGWGTEKNYKTGRTLPYWVCANSWGKQWGENGYFKILRRNSEIDEYLITTWGRSN